MFRTLVAWIVFIPWTLFVILTGVPLSFINPDWLHAYAKIWARFGLALIGARLIVEGTEHLDASRPVVYMPNHQSNVDILALFAGIPGQFRWMAKEELFRIPLFGYAMARTGYISINRSDRRQAAKSMAVAAQRIAAGTSVVIFPEGTRSTDGRLLPFKKGGFLLALSAQTPIVPVAIDGSRDIMRKGRLAFRPGDIRIRFFPAVTTAGRQTADRDRLIEEVRQPIAAALGQPVEDSPA